MTRLGRRHLAAALILGMGAGAGCAPQKPERLELEIAALAFSPEAPVVAVGDTVVWSNRDLVPHTVTAEGALRSGEIGAGMVFETVLTEPGVIRYVCDYHPTMEGRITVVER